MEYTTKLVVGAGCLDKLLNMCQLEMKCRKYNFINTICIAVVISKTQALDHFITL